MRRLLLLALLCLLQSGAALAATFSAPIPDLVGPVDFTPSHGARTASFDVGQRFAEIESVWIEVEAQVFAREFDVCGTFFDPQPCEHQVELLGFVAFMDEQESETIGFIFSEGLSFGDFRDLEGAGIDVAAFSNSLVGWDFLLDGESSLTLFWNDVFGDPDRIIKNVIEPSGEIFDARIIIEGTPVPEPSTALLVAAGLLALARQRNR